MTTAFTKVENIVEIDNPSEWKDIRIKEINAMGLKCDDSHPWTRKSWRFTIVMQQHTKNF